MRRRSANVDEDFVAAQLDRIALDTVGRLLGEFAGGDVVLPAVPGTSYDRTVELTFTERATVMQAYTIDCKQLTVNVGYGNGLPADRNLADLAWWDFVDFTCALECHWFALSEVV
ncbi:MAG TPA: hypothetical protein VGR94_05970 [Candidatus Acidoferrales bacterium]|nr:hypothetical protein [Candidatus Acidoferrales bacterium]